jgi:hypothetical protein
MSDNSSMRSWTPGRVMLNVIYACKSKVDLIWPPRATPPLSQHNAFIYSLCIQNSCATNVLVLQINNVIQGTNEDDPPI